MEIILENAKDLKIEIFPKSVRFLHLQVASTLSMLLTVSWKFFSLYISELYEKWTPRILTASVSRFMHFKSRSATSAPFFTPIPAISHFDLLAFRPENSEKVSNDLKISIMEFVFF